jgi:hypothetical protein
MEGAMSDWDTSADDNLEDKTISLDDLEDQEQDSEHQDDPYYDEDDWGESFDDLDSEAWERQYHTNDLDEVESDPWELG